MSVVLKILGQDTAILWKLYIAVAETEYSDKLLCLKPNNCILLVNVYDKRGNMNMFRWLKHTILSATNNQKGWCLRGAAGFNHGVDYLGVDVSNRFFLTASLTFFCWLWCREGIQGIVVFNLLHHRVYVVRVLWSSLFHDKEHGVYSFQYLNSLFISCRYFVIVTRTLPSLFTSFPVLDLVMNLNLFTCACSCFQVSICAKLSWWSVLDSDASD